MTPVLHALIVQASLPLKAIESDFSVDSTGFTSSRFDRWYDHKYQQEKLERDWVKVHICAGVTTNVVTAVAIYGRSQNDSPILPELVNATAKNFAVNN